MALKNAFADLATEQTLLSINSKIPAEGGLTDTQLRASPVNTENIALYDLVDTLNDLVSRLGVLLSARAVDGTLRVSGSVVVGSGTITQVSTVATLSNQVSIGGYQATSSIQNQMNTVAQLANTVNIGI